MAQIERIVQYGRDPRSVQNVFLVKYTTGPALKSENRKSVLGLGTGILGLGLGF